MAITNPSFTNIRNTLGATTYDLGSLCVHTNINRWSKFKPVRFNKVTGLTPLEFKSVRSGMVIPSVEAHPSSGYVPIMNYYRNNPTFQFGYNKPRGVGSGYNENYRAGDFRNYEHYAGIFYDVEVPSQLVISPLRVDLYNFDTPYWLDWEALRLEDHYFGAILVKKNQTSPIIMEWAADPLSENDNRLTFTITPTPPVGTQYDLFPFISLPLSDPEDPDNLTFYLLENGYKTVTFVGLLTIELHGELMGGAVEWSLSIHNNGTAGPEVLQSSEVLIRYADNSSDDELDPLEPGEGYISLGNVSVPASTTVNLGDQRIGLLPNFATRGGKIHFKNQTYPSYNASTNIIES